MNTLFENIECHDCKGADQCAKPKCDHCVKQRQHEAESIETIVAFPCTFESIYPKSINNEIKNDTHTIRTVSADGNISIRVQKEVPTYTSRKYNMKTFNVTLNNEVSFKGNTTENLISTDNKRNNVARRLAEGRKPQSYDTLWLKTSNDQDTQYLHVDGDIKIDMKDAFTRDVLFPSIKSSSTANNKNKNRQLNSFIQQQMIIKGYDPKTHSVYQSDNMRFTVDTINGVLKDVEIDMVQPVEHVIIEEKYKCDPMNNAEVTGLLAALEERIPLIQSKMDRGRATQLFSTIDEHRRKLDDIALVNKGYEAPAEVNAAVREATEFLWKQNNLIGTFVRVNRWYKSLTKRPESIESTFLPKAKDIVERYKELSDKLDQKFNAIVYAKKKLVKAEGKDLYKAVSKALNIERDETFKTQLKFIRQYLGDNGLN